MTEGKGEFYMLKVALVGVGAISGAHIPAWMAMEDVELVALCDVRPEQMEKYPKQRHYTDFDQMLASETLDIVDICLPTYLHVEFARKAMQRGIHVLCEKPISLHRADVEPLYELAKEKNVRYMVAHVVRFWPGYEALKEIYDTKKYGKLISGTMQRLGQFPQWSWNNWMQKEACSGMVPFDLHIHDLDFLVYAFGIPKDKVVFRAKRSDSDFLNITYDFGDFFVQTQASWYATKDHPFTACYSFQFEDALVEFREERLKIYLRDGGVIDSGGEAGALGAIDLPQTDAYANEIRYFTDCVENGTDCEKVRAEELAAVLDILNNI